MCHPWCAYIAEHVISQVWHALMMLNLFILAIGIFDPCFWEGHAGYFPFFRLHFTCRMLSRTLFLLCLDHSALLHHRHCFSASHT